MFQRKVFLHVVLLLIYIFLLVDLISKLYSLYIYIIWHVLCYWYIHFISRLLLSLSILINQLYTFFCMFCHNIQSLVAAWQLTVGCMSSKLSLDIFNWYVCLKSQHFFLHFAESTNNTNPCYIWRSSSYRGWNKKNVSRNLRITCLKL